MPLLDVETTIEKAVTSIAKLGKTETDDKVKKALLAGAYGIERQIPDLRKKQADLNKRIKDTKSLDADTGRYKKDVSDLVRQCATLLKLVKDCKPDTKNRDYFKIGNALDSFSGAAALDSDKTG